MEGIAAEVSQKLKSAIKAKLMELGAYVDEELPNYVMVMVTNRRSKAEMDRELNLFLGGNTSTFTSWLQSVWTKLEQVTVANLGTEKKKSLEKKKKVKKSRSSSESEDDRKHKRKRKSSTTSEASLKENKKRKSIKQEVIDETESLSKDATKDISNKKTRGTKAEVRSNMDLESDHEDDTSSVDAAKPIKADASVLEEEDFLNIKEDFESGFLSDEEDSKGKPKLTDKKISSKLAPIEKSDTAIKKNSIEKSSKPEPAKITDKSKDKENKNTENSAANATENRPKPGKTILIRNRKVVKSRSRSPARSRSPSPKNQKIVKTVSPFRSRSNSPVNNVIKIREKSPIVDARELLNRKRAMQNAALERSKDDKIPLKRAFVVKNDDTIVIRDGPEKENDLRNRLPDNTKSDKSQEKTARILTKDTKSAISKSKDRIDLRKIKRTVYVGNEDCAVEETDEKAKIRKSVVNQIVKYIKEDPSVASTVVKAPKIARPKTNPVQSASGTLIRKAMADAHKSLTTKEEPSKKREVQDNRNKISSNVKEEIKQSSVEQINVEEDTNDVELISNNTIALDQDDEEMKDHSRLITPKEIEEYDPSENMPQFVVTLTGLDPKLYPEEDIELNENLDMETDPNDQQEIFYSDVDENKTKSKLPERCKYYPNCLAGDQCLYHHPTIPCKMFPNCKYGNSCLYVHPKCKFDAACTRYDCPFLHTSAKMTPSVATRHAPPPSAIGAQPCKFYYNCVNPVCPFQHPKICRYDRHCMNKNCTYQHTSLSHVSAFSKDKLKWSKPKNEADEKQENAMGEL